MIYVYVCYKQITVRLTKHFFCSYKESCLKNFQIQVRLGSTQHRKNILMIGQYTLPIIKKICSYCRPGSNGILAQISSQFFITHSSTWLETLFSNNSMVLPPPPNSQLRNDKVLRRTTVTKSPAPPSKHLFKAISFLTDAVMVSTDSFHLLSWKLTWHLRKGSEIVSCCLFYS